MGATTEEDSTNATAFSILTENIRSGIRIWGRVWDREGLPVRHTRHAMSVSLDSASEAFPENEYRVRAACARVRLGS
jgi:hypothetical protein